jgi:hypothetical protein
MSRLATYVTAVTTKGGKHPVEATYLFGLVLATDFPQVVMSRDCALAKSPYGLIQIGASAGGAAGGFSSIGYGNPCIAVP